MDSMHKHLANKCPVRFPNKKAEVAASSGAVSDFEIATATGAEKHKDDDSSDDDDDDDNTTTKTMELAMTRMAAKKKKAHSPTPQQQLRID
jgi:hypothetical protein